MQALRKKSDQIKAKIKTEQGLQEDDKNTTMIIIIVSVSAVVLIIGGVVGYIYFARWSNRNLKAADPYTGGLTSKGAENFKYKFDESQSPEKVKTDRSKEEQKSEKSEKKEKLSKSSVD